jgi:molybdenum cofactor synthesis domain-containing protein
VAAREQIQIRSDGSAVMAAPAPGGLNVRARGEDFAAGALLVPAGRRLRPADLAAAAAAGHTTLAVTRQPVVAIVPTGDEVRPVGMPLGPGDIVDSNSVMLAARAAQAGAWTVVSEVQPDEPAAIAAAVRRAAAVADLVLVLAGSSAGRVDYTAAVLGQVGAESVHGVELALISTVELTVFITCSGRLTARARILSGDSASVPHTCHAARRTTVMSSRPKALEATTGLGISRSAAVK